MTVEGSQGDLAAMELELAERGVCNVPGELEGIAGWNLGQDVEQGSDGAAGGEHGDGLLVVGPVEKAVEPGRTRSTKPSQVSSCGVS